MHQYSQEHENHLSGITRLVSTYRAVTLEQACRLYPELTREKMKLLIRRLERGGRLSYDPARDLLLCPGDPIPNPSVTKALWVVADFADSLTYHTAGEFPVTLSFYADSDAYEVIHVPYGREALMNHALAQKEGAEKRLVIVDETEQIPRLSFPGAVAFCTVDDDGRVQYFKKCNYSEPHS